MTDHRFWPISFLALVVAGAGCGPQAGRIFGGTPATADSGKACPTSVPSPAIKDPASPRFGLNVPLGWAALPIPVRLSTAFSEDQAAAVNRAMLTWEQAVGKQLFARGDADPQSGDGFAALYDSLADGGNGIYLKDDWARLQNETCASDRKDIQVLATTIWQTMTDPVRIEKADIEFNDEFYEFGDSLTAPHAGRRGLADLESVALHELGHFLGLAHVSVDGDSVMSAEVWIGAGQTQRALSGGDVGRIRKIYGCAGAACDQGEARGQN